MNYLDLIELYKKESSNVISNLSSDSILEFVSLVIDAFTNEKKIFACGNGGNAAYVSTKGAINAMTSALALELAPWDIRVNALVSGHIDSPDNLKEILADDGRRERYLNCLAMKRLESTDKIVKTVVYLVSDKARHVTGQQIKIEDGMKMWQGLTD